MSDGIVWSREPPKEIGVYWCRVQDKKEDIRLCIVVRRDGQFWVCATSGEYGTPLKWFSERRTEWSGPLNPEKPKRVVICEKCGFEFNSINCCEFWKDAYECERKIIEP